MPARGAPSNPAGHHTDAAGGWSRARGDEHMGSEIFAYTGKRVIVTGAASGMGEATARIIGELGGEVHALDVNPPRVDVAHHLHTDLRDPQSIDAAVDEIGGPVHALFNCAGLPGGKFPGLDVMTSCPSPTRQMDGQVRIAANHSQPVAWGQAQQGMVHQQLGASVEANVLKVDSRQR